MHRLQSQIPKLKPASSYGNLTQLAPKATKPRSLHGSRQNLHVNPPVIPDRTPMISAPTPVTHRRMFPNHYASQPPWAIDDSISPFDPEPVKKKPEPRNDVNRRTQSEYGSRRDHERQPVPIRLESTSPSLDYMQYALPRDDLDRNFSPFDNESYYRSEIQRFVSPTLPMKQVSASQTDLTGFDIDFIQKPKNSGFQPTASPRNNLIEKKYVLPIKELKRSSNKNYPTYKVNKRPQDPVDFNKVFNEIDRLPNKSDEEIQSRIDYWLNKSVSTDPARQEQAPQSGLKETPVNQDTMKPMFRNQITFTPRPMKREITENGTAPKSVPYSSNSQVIEAVIFQSDSESEKDYIVSSKSMENKINRSNSHFTIRANFASKGKSTRKETTPCEVCHQPLQDEDQMNYDGIICHNSCFKCFWCKKKLSLDNYKVNVNKLCCPLHHRLSAN